MFSSNTGTNAFAKPDSTQNTGFAPTPTPVGNSFGTGLNSLPQFGGPSPQARNGQIDPQQIMSQIQQLLQKFSQNDSQGFQPPQGFQNNLPQPYNPAARSPMGLLAQRDAASPYLNGANGGSVNW